MKHSYLYIILSLCLTSAVSTVSPSPAPAESETQDFPDVLPKPEGNAFESEEAKRSLYERAEPLYQNQLSLLDSTFKDEYSYTFVDIGAQYPVMLAAYETFSYEIAESIHACMWCNVYYPKEDDVRLLDRLSSLGTAYPIAFDEAGLYEAGSKGVRKWSIKMEEGSPELVAVEAAYVSYDEDGNSSYSAI